MHVMFIFVTLTLVQVFSREVDVNKWEIVCVVLDKHASLKVEDSTLVFINSIY